MRDSEYDYPKHQPIRGKDDHGWDEPFEENQDGERKKEEEPRYGRRSPVHQRERATLPELPRAHASKALITGAIIGALVVLEGIFFTLRNADLYREAAKYAKPELIPSGIALNTLGLAVLTFGIGIVLFFIGGLIIGRISVHRRWGFIGGFVGGVVNWLIGLLVQWIPSYPNAGRGGFSGNLLGLSQGIVAVIIGAILGGVVAGLASLLGAWLATRRHPYYVGYSG